MADYYVKNDGDDTKAGTSDALAWKTINKVNGETFSAGDNIYFNKGDTWREQLTVPSSGSSGSPITISSYGSGADPIINGADLVSTWTAYVPAQNLPNGNMESWAGATNLNTWVEGTAGSSSVNQESSEIHEGTYSCRFDIDASNNTAYIKQTPFGSLEASTAYTFSFWYKFSGAGVDYHWTVHDVSNTSRLQADGSWGATVFQDIPNATDWTYEEINFTTQAGCNTFEIYFHNNNGCGSASFYLDDVAIRKNIPNVWQATCTTEPSDLFIDETFGDEKTAIANLVNEYDWFWDSNVLYVYSATDPDSAYTDPGIEAPARVHCLNLNTKDYITVDGIEFHYANHTTGYIEGSCINARSADYCIIQNCTTKWSSKWGMQLAGNQYPEVSDNTLTDDCGGGIQLIDVDYGTINGNTISCNGEDSINIKNDTNDTDVYGNTFLPGTFSATPYNGLSFDTDGDLGGRLNVYSNTITGTARGGSKLASGIAFYSLQSDDVANRSNIYLNTITDVSGNGIYIQGENTNVYRNKVEDSGAGGIAVDDHTSTTANISVYYNLVINSTDRNLRATGSNLSNVKFYNNVCYGGARGLELTTGCTDIIAKNNIFSGQSGYAIFADAVTGHTIDYNCYYKASGDWYSWDGSTGDTLAGWKSDSSQGAHDINANPLMTDPANGDFTLQVSSPCQNTGVTVYANNVVKNSSFEDDDDWVAYGTDAAVNRGDTTVHSGTYSFEVLSGVVNSGIAAATDVYGSVTAGKTYEVSAWIYCVGGDITATYGITDDGTAVLATETATEDLTNGNWSHATFTTLCTTSGTVRPFVTVNGSAWAFIVDDFTISERLEEDYAGNVIAHPPNIGAYEEDKAVSGSNVHMYQNLGMT